MMQTWMIMVVKQSNADATGTSGYVEYARQNRNPPLIARLLSLRFPSGSPPLPPCDVHGDDGGGEGEGRKGTAGYEERLQAEGADVGNEGDIWVDLSGITRAAVGEPVDEECEKGDDPDGATD